MSIVVPSIELNVTDGETTTTFVEEVLDDELGTATPEETLQLIVAVADVFEQTYAFTGGRWMHDLRLMRTVCVQGHQSCKGFC